MRTILQIVTMHEDYFKSEKTAEIGHCQKACVAGLDKALGFTPSPEGVGREAGREGGTLETVQ